MYCSMCGQENPDIARYCSICGEKLIGTQKQQSPSEKPSEPTDSHKLNQISDKSIQPLAGMQPAKTCPYCYADLPRGVTHCPSCGSFVYQITSDFTEKKSVSTRISLPEKRHESVVLDEGQDLQKPLGCFAYSLIGIIAPILPIVIIYILSLSNIFTQNALATITTLLSLATYPTIWYFAAKGRYNKVNFYGYLNVLVLSFIPLGNWWVVYYLGKALYMTHTKQELRNPPKASKTGLVILLIVIGLYVAFNIFSSPQVSQSSTSPTSNPVVKQATITHQPTKRSATTIPSTKVQVTFNNLPCISWAKVDKADLDSRICIYGKIYDYGPYSNKWTYIQFSGSSNAFRVMDFNYYYDSPLKVGNCVIVYGKIRDYGSYLIITPDKDTEGSVRVGAASLCD